MAAVRVNITVEVEQKGNGLAIQTPVPIQLVQEQGRWRAECESPSLCTESFDTLEQAVVAGAKQVGNELQAAVNERPIIAGKITPADVPQGLF